MFPGAIAGKFSKKRLRPSLFVASPVKGRSAQIAGQNRCSKSSSQPIEAAMSSVASCNNLKKTLTVGKVCTQCYRAPGRWR